MPLSTREVLARCPLFAELTDDDLDALGRVASCRAFGSGQSVFLQGNRSEGLHIVVSGRIKIFVLSPESGREVVLTTEGPYHAVAELPSLDGGAYPANAQALEDSRTLFLEQTAFLGVLHERPAISLHLIRTLGQRLRRLVGLVEQLSFQEVIHRLASYLLNRREDGLPFDLETNAAIAAQLGTVPELVSRNLSRLQGSGAVTLSQRSVVELDGAALRELAKRAGR